MGCLFLFPQRDYNYADLLEMVFPEDLSSNVFL